MKIEQVKKFTGWDIFAIIGVSIVWFMTIYTIMLAIFGIIFIGNLYDDNFFKIASSDKMIIIKFFESYGLIIFVSLIFSILFLIFSKFKMILRYRCIVCDKEMYEDSKDIIILNKKEVENDIEQRIACKKHKRPYMIPLPMNYFGKEWRKFR